LPSSAPRPAEGARGGAQQQVRDALLYPGAIVLEEPEVALPVAWEHFDEDGRLVDEKTRDSIRGLLEGLVAAPRAQQRVEAA
jgi:NAD(P)H-dependent FMN reductase